MKRFLVLTVIGIILCGCAWVGAADNDETLLQEIKALREDIAALRKDLEPLLARNRSIQGDREGATDSAMASNIVSNLRGLKSACILLISDIISDGAQPPTDITPLMKYVDNPSRYPEGHYLIKIVEDRWYLGFSAKNAAISDGVKKKLSERAESLGFTSSPDTNAEKYTNQDIVWMIAK